MALRRVVKFTRQNKMKVVEVEFRDEPTYVMRHMFNKRDIVTKKSFYCKEDTNGWLDADGRFVEAWFCLFLNDEWGKQERKKEIDKTERYLQHNKDKKIVDAPGDS